MRLLKQKEGPGGLVFLVGLWALVTAILLGMIQGKELVSNFFQ